MTQEEVLFTVYLVLGNPSEDLLPQEIVNHFIDQWEVLYPLDTDSCLLTYKTVISSTNYILSKLTNEGDGDTEGIRRREREGDVEIEEEYKNGSPAQGWRKWLDAFLKDPTLLLPCLASEEGFSSSAMPIVTGLDREKYIGVISNPNNISGGARIGSLWDTSDNQLLDSYTRGNQSLYRGRRR
ncbi:hypothetical protein VP14_045 [Vibrio phage VPMCC14]|nr:hypothetical protein VP14_045 [Vibrio phage VPMCC14]